jgi:hypothetical protein
MSERIDPIVSPKGLMKYGWLHKANKFGNFVVDLVLSGEEAAAFQARLKDLAEKARANLIENVKPPKGKTQAAARKELESYTLHFPGKPETDENGEETGNTVFTFGNKETGKKKDGSTFKVRIDVVDSKRNKLNPAKVGRGSQVKVAFEPVPFAMASTKLIGISGRLRAVQVIDLKEFSGGGAAAFGDEDGYVNEGGDEEAAPAEASAPAGDGSDY